MSSPAGSYFRTYPDVLACPFCRQPVPVMVCDGRLAGSGCVFRCAHCDENFRVRAIAVLKRLAELGNPAEPASA